MNVGFANYFQIHNLSYWNRYLICFCATIRNQYQPYGLFDTLFSLYFHLHMYINIHSFLSMLKINTIIFRTLEKFKNLKGKEIFDIKIDIRSCDDHRSDINFCLPFKLLQPTTLPPTHPNTSVTRC